MSYYIHGTEESEHFLVSLHKKLSESTNLKLCDVPKQITYYFPEINDSIEFELISEKLTDRDGLKRRVLYWKIWMSKGNKPLSTQYFPFDCRRDALVHFYTRLTSGTPVKCSMIFGRRYLNKFDAILSVEETFELNDVLVFTHFSFVDNYGDSLFDEQCVAWVEFGLTLVVDVGETRFKLFREITISQSTSRIEYVVERDGIHFEAFNNVETAYVRFARSVSANP